MGKEKERLDVLLVRKGLAGSRERARALIMAGKVIVEDHVVDKAGLKVPVDAALHLKGNDIPFVSRGGMKLQGALESFKIPVMGRIAIDVGASTGGFTDCLLQRGAARVYAVDVGYGQLDWKLRQDPRVVNMERTNIRFVDPETLPEKPTLAVVDASFISLSKILPVILDLLAANAEIVALIKPQFEVGRQKVGKGGVVRSEKDQLEAVETVKDLSEQLGCKILGIMESPLRGPKGNREFLIYLRK